MPYQIPDDFAFIASLTRISFVIALNPKVPIKTIAELIAYAKANPGKLNYGSAGLGSAPHMGLALLGTAAQIDMVHVPFGGLGPALNAVMAGTVDLSLTTVPFAKPQVDGGTVRVLALTGHVARSAIPRCSDLAGGRPAGDRAGVLRPARAGAHAGADPRPHPQGDGRDRQGAGRDRATAKRSAIRWTISMATPIGPSSSRTSSNGARSPRPPTFRSATKGSSAGAGQATLLGRWCELNMVAISAAGRGGLNR